MKKPNIEKWGLPLKFEYVDVDNQGKTYTHWFTSKLVYDVTEVVELNEGEEYHTVVRYFKAFNPTVLLAHFMNTFAEQTCSAEDRSLAEIKRHLKTITADGEGNDLAGYIKELVISLSTIHLTWDGRKLVVAYLNWEEGAIND